MGNGMVRYSSLLNMQLAYQRVRYVLQEQEIDTTGMTIDQMKEILR